MKLAMHNSPFALGFQNIFYIACIKSRVPAFVYSLLFPLGTVASDGKQFRPKTTRGSSHTVIDSRLKALEADLQSVNKTV